LKSVQSDYYILDQDRRPIPCDNVLAWSDMFNDFAGRLVAKTEGDGWELVTVFVGLNICGDGPVLFETALFNGARWKPLARSDTWSDAQAAHETAHSAASLHENT
jgi:hypothetical protein